MRVVSADEKNGADRNILQPRRIKCLRSPERNLRCYRTGLCLCFANFSRQPRKTRLSHSQLLHSNFSIACLNLQFIPVRLIPLH